MPLILDTSNIKYFDRKHIFNTQHRVIKHTYMYFICYLHLYINVEYSYCNLWIRMDFYTELNYVSKKEYKFSGALINCF